MQDLSADETPRWNDWREADAVTARRSDRFVRITGTVMFSAVTVALAAALWLR